MYCKKLDYGYDKRRDGRKLMGQDMFEDHVQDPQRKTRLGV